MDKKNIKTYHDEPFVVDNFPLGIDVGEKHGMEDRVEPARGESANWVRKESELEHIMVLQRKPNGDPDFIATKLDQNIPVTITLRGVSDSDQLILTFSSGDKLSIDARGFNLHRNGRRLTQSGPRRIKEISWRIPGETQLSSVSIEQDSKSVYCVLF